MIIDGRQIAKDIQSELIDNAAGLSLHIFIVGEDPVIESFVKYKKIFAEKINVQFVEHRFSDDITEAELIHIIRGVISEADGIVVQLPLPLHMDTQRVLDSVPSNLDVDGLATSSAYLTPVAGAIKEIINLEKIIVSGKKVLVVGEGKLVGKPVAKLLAEMEAEVTSIDNSVSKEELIELCRNSDIIVSGAGVPNLITKDMLKEGVVLLDAGTSTQAGNLVGDIAMECEELASIFSRTPGGIGPMTVAILFKNLVTGTVTR